MLRFLLRLLELFWLGFFFELLGFWFLFQVLEFLVLRFLLQLFRLGFFFELLGLWFLFQILELLELRLPGFLEARAVTESLDQYLVLRTLQFDADDRITTAAQEEGLLHPLCRRGGGDRDLLTAGIETVCGGSGRVEVNHDQLHPAAGRSGDAGAVAGVEPLDSAPLVDPDGSDGGIGVVEHCEGGAASAQRIGVRGDRLLGESDAFHSLGCDGTGFGALAREQRFQPGQPLFDGTGGRRPLHRRATAEGGVAPRRALEVFVFQQRRLLVCVLLEDLLDVLFQPHFFDRTLFQLDGLLSLDAEVDVQLVEHMVDGVGHPVAAVLRTGEIEADHAVVFFHHHRPGVPAVADLAALGGIDGDADLVAECTDSVVIPDIDRQIDGIHDTVGESGGPPPFAYRHLHACRRLAAYGPDLGDFATVAAVGESGHGAVHPVTESGTKQAADGVRRAAAAIDPGGLAQGVPVGPFFRQDVIVAQYQDFPVVSILDEAAQGTHVDIAVHRLAGADADPAHQGIVQGGVRLGGHLADRDRPLVEHEAPLDDIGLHAIDGGRDFLLGRNVLFLFHIDANGDLVGLLALYDLGANVDPCHPGA